MILSPTALAGCTMLITADRRASELGTALERRGARIMHAPSLTIIPHIDDAALIASTHELLQDPPDIVVVTTGIGFRGWIEAADAAGLAEPLLEALRRAQLVARGPKARGAIQATGLTADWVAESETTAEITTWLLAEGVAGQKVAVQHHGAGSDGIDEALLAAGAQVRSLIVYRWGPPPDQERLNQSVHASLNGDIDAVVFTSAPGVNAWLAAAAELGVVDDVVRACQRSDLVAAAVGPVTAAPLLGAGISPIIPERGRLGALVRSLVVHFGTETPSLDTIGGRLQIRRAAAVLDGKVIPASPSGLAVLRVLAAHAGSVVPRASLLSVLPGSSSDEHAAEVAVARLREALGQRDIIQTVIKRGYV
ncbi:MAG: uroporphyrinogen-III synthase, partial [Angustibacter sp.]